MFKDITTAADIIIICMGKIDMRKIRIIQGKSLEIKNKLIFGLDHKFDKNIFNSQIKKYLEEYGEKNKNLFYALISFVDEYYAQDFKINNKKNFNSNISSYNRPLNTINDNTDWILPKLTETVISLMKQNLPKDNNNFTKKFRHHKINKILKNYVYIKKQDFMSNFEINVIKYEDVDLKNSILKEEAIRIQMVPFLMDDIREYFMDEVNDSNWKALGLKPESKNKYIERYLLSLKYSVTLKQKPHIIIFPEMILSDDILDLLPKKLNEYAIGFPCIIVAGTLWENNTNTCYVFNNYGKSLMKQTKFNPYEITTNDGVIYEDLKLESKHIYNLLDIDGIGRLVIHICKDFFEEEYRSMIGRVDADIVLIPSYTPRESVVRHDKETVEDYQCIVAYTNVCNRVIYTDKEGKTKVEIGSVTFPTEQSHRNYSQTIVINKTLCKDCNNFCDGELIKIPLNGKKI